VLEVWVDPHAPGSVVVGSAPAVASVNGNAQFLLSVRGGALRAGQLSIGPYDAMRYRAVRFRAVPCRAVPCGAVPCGAVRCDGMCCHVPSACAGYSLSSVPASAAQALPGASVSLPTNDAEVAVSFPGLGPAEYTMTASATSQGGKLDCVGALESIQFRTWRLHCLCCVHV
jgi:hypothetical protein